MEKIKMVDLHTQYLRCKAEIDDAIRRVLESTAFIQGEEVSEFSNRLSQYIGGAHVITCANGTEALQVAMMALGLKPGDEVILPVHTYVAAAEVISLLGLMPVFVDVNEQTFNIDVNQIESKITAKTRAIVPVHLYGQCADMEPILKISAQHDLFVIEDAAQSLGAQYFWADGNSARAGTMGTVGTTSFFPTKNLGCFGDGGAIFSSDQTLANQIRMIANHGQKTKYYHDIIGVNSRLDTLQAAVLLVKLKYIDEYEQRRNAAAALYDRCLQGIAPLQIPVKSGNSTHVFHQYTLRAERRDELKSFLSQNGIPSLIYYPVPLHLQKAYRRPEYGVGSFPVSEKLSKDVISLPIHTEMPSHQIEYVSETIKKFYNG